ncbi:MAG: MAPEG family protein [Rhodospirillales bacterium]
MPGKITAIYAGLLGLLLLVLSINVIRLRWKHQQGIMDGGHRDLARAIRVQGNFTEYVPLALILMFFVEAAQYPAAAIHAFGLALVAGRCAHAWGLSRSETRTPGRAAGVTLTFAVLVAASLMVLAAGFGRL